MAEADAALERPTAAPGIEFLRNKWVQGALIAAGLFFLYYLTGNESNPFNQYARLADAFWHGRLYIKDPPDYLELARYLPNGDACEGPEPGCKGYVIDPPAPALLLMPFVLVFGADLNQVLVSMFFGGAAMGLFWVATRQMGWDYKLSAAMTALLALGTNFWWAAADGGLWTYAQVASVFFMMAALVEATGKKRPWLVGLLVGLSGLSRLPTFLAFPFFLYLCLKDDVAREDAGLRPWRELIRDRQVISKVLLFGTGLGAMAFLVLLYNYARFDSIFDKGYDHPQYQGQPWFPNGRFSISYIPRHIEGIFYFGPEINEHRIPFFTPSQFGMALIMVTPAFLYAYGAKVRRLEIIAAATLLLVAVPHLLHGTTGWAQFGYRFSMDYFPMLIVLTASGMGYGMATRKWLVVALSIFIAMWGPLFFFDTRLEDILGYQWML